MAIILSNATLADMQTGWYPNFTGPSFYDGFSYDYATLYRTQPNVRTVVDFLSRNIAQLGLHVYRRLENDDRTRLRDHQLAKVLNMPLPADYKVTRYRLIESLMGDLGIYYNAYWLKLKRNDGLTTGLLRIPPHLVVVNGGLAPIEYQVNFGNGTKVFTPNEIVHFRGYNADSPVVGLSPLETLRRVLAEEHAAGQYREYYWKNSARMSGLIERPVGAPEWSDAARARFKSEFESLYSGSANSGKTAILEEGMTWKSGTFNAEESQYLEGRKLTREECARAYHIPPTLVGILEHASFSNITEQHKMLYTDVIGPWLAMIEQEIELQLLPEFEDTDGVYVEFNIQEKMQGDFEQQAQSFQASVGRPWMTANEARSRMNLPRLDDGDELVTPLNVLVGGQASLLDSAPKELKSEMKTISAKLDDDEKKYIEKWQQLITKTFVRQRAAILSRALASTETLEVIFDADRWNKELKEDMLELNVETIMVWVQFLAKSLGIEVNEAPIRLWAEKNAEIAAENINKSTLEQLIKSYEEEEEDKPSALKRVFEFAIGVRAFEIAQSKITGLSNFGTHYVAENSGGLVTKKTWNLGPGKEHRSSHIHLDGETVWIRQNFSNGLRWPGDAQNDRTGGDETANCGCYLTYS